MWILEAVSELHKNKVKFAIAGGYAVALHGAVRGTIDIDIVVVLTLENLKRLETACKNLGLESRIPILAQDLYSFREEYIKNRNLIAWSFINPRKPSQVIDIIITHDLKDLGVKQISVHGVKVPIVDVPSLIKMKRAAGRPQDLEDIKALESINEES